MRQRTLIMYIIDQDTGGHIDSIVYGGAPIDTAMMAAKNLIKSTWTTLSKRSINELKKISQYLAREFPMTFQDVRKDTEYMAYCVVLVDMKLVSGY